MPKLQEKLPDLSELIELLQIINQGKEKVQVECNYDGYGGWKWRLFQPNVKAGDYIIRKRRVDTEKVNR